MGALWADWKSKKLSFWDVLFSYSVQQQQTISHSDCDTWCKVGFIRQSAITSLVDCDEAPKHFPKPKLHQKKIMVTVWWSTTGLIHYSFLNPGETIISEKYAQQIDVMHPKQQLLQLSLVSRKGLVLFHDNTWPHIAQPVASKTEWIGYKVLLHLPYSPDLSPTHSSISKTVCRENASITSRRKIMLSKSSSNPEAQIFVI